MGCPPRASTRSQTRLESHAPGGSCGGANTPDASGRSRHGSTDRSSQNALQTRFSPRCTTSNRLMQAGEPHDESEEGMTVQPDPSPEELRAKAAKMQTLADLIQEYP